MIPRDISKYNTLLSGYTELRIQENRSIHITLVDGTVMANNQSSISGVSARVQKNDAWGFASTPDLSDNAIRAVISSASENAAFMDVKLQNEARSFPAIPGSASHDFSTAKTHLSQRELIEFLKDLDGYVQNNCPGITSRTIVLSCLDMEKVITTSEQSEAYSMIPRSILYIIMQREKAGTPFELLKSLGDRGQFEDVFSVPSELYHHIDELYEDLKKKTDGIYAEAGLKECILDADLAGVLAHEAIGHTTEADLVLGGSVASSFLGKQVASPLVTLVDYANEAFGKTCPVPVYVDDEGTKARDAVLIENGVLNGYMHNRDTAAIFDATPTGNAKAFRFSDEPIIRMRNTSFVPGESSLEEMISSVDDGYYLMRFNNGQADTTSEFMFGITLGYEIKKGKLGRAIRNTTISGVAFEMLHTVSMISHELKWSNSGMCGKKQMIPVGLGGPAIKCKVAMGGR